MKYAIRRTFAIRNKKFEITRDSEFLCTAKVTSSKEYKGRYNIKLSNPIDKYTGDYICLVEPDPKQPGGYLIYLQNSKTEKKILFGQLFRLRCDRNDYSYTIIIGEKLYQIRSSDLKGRPLTITDVFQSRDSSGILNHPNTLCQVNEPFSKSNKIHHLTISDQKRQYGYLAIVILLDLHECKRNLF
jgi:hypothetical protein